MGSGQTKFHPISPLVPSLGTDPPNLIALLGPRRRVASQASSHPRNRPPDVADRHPEYSSVPHRTSLFFSSRKRGTLCVFAKGAPHDAIIEAPQGI
jgi:hypothetical protein